MIMNQRAVLARAAGLDENARADMLCVNDVTLPPGICAVLSDPGG